MKAIKIISQFIPVLFMIGFIGGVFHSMHVPMNEKSGWLALSFVCAGMMVVSLGNMGWSGILLVIGCMFIAGIFAIHFMFGAEGFRTIGNAVHWMGQQLSKGYTGAFH
jgi:hypothetical protein